MLTVSELRSISAARLEDAQALYDSSHYDGVVYLCGYAVELALKARICETLNWNGYPATNREFRDYQTFRTHDLKVLLRLSGHESRIWRLYLMIGVLYPTGPLSCDTGLPAAPAGQRRPLYWNMCDRSWSQYEEQEKIYQKPDGSGTRPV